MDTLSMVLSTNTLSDLVSSTMITIVMKIGTQYGLSSSWQHLLHRLLSWTYWLPLWVTLLIECLKLKCNLLLGSKLWWLTITSILSTSMKSLEVMVIFSKLLKRVLLNKKLLTGREKFLLWERLSKSKSSKLIRCKLRISTWFNNNSAKSYLVNRGLKDKSTKLLTSLVLKMKALGWLFGKKLRKVTKVCQPNNLKIW